MKKTQENDRRLYSDITEEIFLVLQKTERKMKYQTYDLKAEKFYIDQETETARFIPSKEDSLERLLKNNIQFAAEENVEELAIKNVMTEQLNKALESLDAAEIELIEALFYQQLTERQYAERIGKSQNAVNKRKKKLLKKLKKWLSGGCFNG